MAPATGVPRSSAHTMAANIGRPCTKFVVPSRGSTTHVTSRASSLSDSVSSVTMPCSGKRRDNSPRRYSSEAWSASVTGLRLFADL